MVDSARKSRDLASLKPIYPAIGGLAPNTLCRWSPFGALQRAQDAVPASSRRIVAQWNLGGATAFAQPVGTVNPGTAAVVTAPQTYPDADWRTLGTYTASITAGCELRLHVVYAPAGLTQIASGFDWYSGGAWAEVRVLTTWTRGANTSGPHATSISMTGSPLGTYGGGEPTNTWMGSILEDEVGGIHPLRLDPAADLINYTEWPDCEIELQVRGGSRLICAQVYEFPMAVAYAHNDTGDATAHVAASSLAPQTPRPMTSASDGTTYEERRFGTQRAALVARTQRERLGPRILSWSSWNESTTSVTADTENDPVSIASATFVDLLTSGVTTYGSDNPGWIVAGAHARQHHLCDPGLIARDEFAVVPVRVRVEARWTTGGSGTGGVVRVQCGVHEYLDLTISPSGTRAVFEQTGYLESQVYPDDPAPPLCVFGRCPSGTLEIWGVSVDYGHDPA